MIGSMIMQLINKVAETSSYIYTFKFRIAASVPVGIEYDSVACQVTLLVLQLVALVLPPYSIMLQY